MTAFFLLSSVSLIVGFFFFRKAATELVAYTVNADEITARQPPVGDAAANYEKNIRAAINELVETNAVLVKEQAIAEGSNYEVLRSLGSALPTYKTYEASRQLAASLLRFSNQLVEVSTFDDENAARALKDVASSVRLQKTIDEIKTLVAEVENQTQRTQSLF